MRPEHATVAELLGGADGGVPDDYKLFVFGGTCRYVSVDRDRFERRTQDFFTADWGHLPMSGGPAWAVPEIPRPARLEEMIRLAERLGQGTDFVRVDLYDLPERLVFGELSSFPAGGSSLPLRSYGGGPDQRRVRKSRSAGAHDVEIGV